MPNPAHEVALDAGAAAEEKKAPAPAERREIVCHACARRALVLCARCTCALCAHCSAPVTAPGAHGVVFVCYRCLDRA